MPEAGRALANSTSSKVGSEPPASVDDDFDVIHATWPDEWSGACNDAVPTMDDQGPLVHHASEEGHVLLNDHGRSSDIVARSWTNDHVRRGSTAAPRASVRMLDTLIDPSLDG